MTDSSRAAVIALYHPTFRAHGGGEMVTAWTWQALLEAGHRVEMLLATPLDIAAVDARYGTELQRMGAAWQVLHHDVMSAWLVHWRQPTLAIWRHFRELRALQRKRNFDLWISSYNAAWLPQRGLQYVHNPSAVLSPEELGCRTDHRRQLWHRWGMRFVAWDAARSMRSPSTQNAWANSAWTAERMGPELASSVSVVHPPVMPFPPGEAWNEREARIVVVGRWAPEKRLDLALDIVAQARANGADLQLDFAGFWDFGEGREGAAMALRDRTAGLPWVRWHDRLSRQALGELVGRCRYGLHCMAEEHLGIAVVEMMSAGCIVLVPEGGTPRAIVGTGGEVYSTPDDAARRIGQLDADPSRAVQMSANARRNAALYSSTRFVTAIQNAVETELRVAKSAR